MSEQVKRWPMWRAIEELGPDDWVVRDTCYDALAQRCRELEAASAMLAAAPAAPVAVGQEPVGKVLSEDEMGIHYDRRMGPVVWFGTPKPGFIYAAPPAAEHLAGNRVIDQLRAEVADLKARLEDQA